MDNDNCTAHIKRIGVPNCDQIRCPKLDGVLKAVLPTNAIKVDGYLLRLQKFCCIPTGSHSGMCGGRDRKGGIRASGAVPEGQCTSTCGTREV